MRNQYIDETGKKYGKLRVLGYYGSCKNGGALFECECNCGGKVIVLGRYLRTGHTQSCGCLLNKPAKNRTHGKAGTSEYSRWLNMKSRCYNKNNPNYKNYGERGISVCAEWKNNFEAFVRDMGPCPNRKSTIDRIDNDGNYEPGNCRWTTRTEQARNKRTSLLIEFGGQTKSLMEWAKDLGIDYKTMHRRIHGLKWDINKALSTEKMEQYSNAKNNRTA